MEPMTLGSPTHSPSSPMNFLPPYLMGEFHQPITPRAGSLSPTKARTLAFGSPPPMRSTPQAPQYSTPLLQKTTSNVSFSNKPNGPPTQGLFDTIGNQSDWNAQQAAPTPFTSPTQSNIFPSRNNMFNDSQSILNPQNQSYLQNQLRGMQNAENQSTILSNESVRFNESFANSEINGNFGEDENEYWVTVFGFPPSASNMILTQFANCGSIIEKKFPPQGNWVWLRFTSRSEIGRALALNGRVLSGGVMVGVLLCSQPPNQGNTFINKSGARQLAVGPPRLQNTSVISPNSSNAGAQRSSGAISRALEYVFGW